MDEYGSLFSEAGETVSQDHELRDWDLSETKTVKGRVGYIDLTTGIGLHYSDNIETTDALEEREVEAGLSITLLLEGNAKFFMNDKVYYLGPSKNKDTAAAFGRIWSLAKPVKFGRVFEKGRKVKKIAIFFDSCWLKNMTSRNNSTSFLSPYQDKLIAFSETHLQSIDWIPNERAVYLAEQIINPDTGINCLNKMLKESQAMELLTIALGIFFPDVHKKPARAASAHQCRLLKIDGYIEENLSNAIRVEHMAKSVGLSESSLRRHFKTAFGSTVADYIRKRKLEVAKDAIIRDGMSVSEACFLAGYSTPSSFTTAFKKVFGVSPSSFAN